MLEIKNLNSGYAKVSVLRNVTFHVNQDETVAIIGPNGAGKSTLLKTISGLVRAQSGDITFENNNILGLSPDLVVRRGLAYVPEGGRIFPNMTVLDNLLMGAYSNPGILKSGILEEIFTLFPILKNRSEKFARTLSGGERQMLAIGRGLVSRPKLIMLDEPSLGVAPKLIDEIYEKIHALKRFGLTVLLVEQNTGYALELADRGYVIENGQIVMEGAATDLSTSEHIKKFYLGL
ncbi:MAG: branched-chain amino acid ABC transporter ATP-binding protein [Anaerolinea sp.]|nr:branched-chain amino acid ABC transporter ATP-binding protein [Anaerolinea sp.]